MFVAMGHRDANLPASRGDTVVIKGIAAGSASFVLPAVVDGGCVFGTPSLHGRKSVVNTRRTRLMLGRDRDQLAEPRPFAFAIDRPPLARTCRCSSPGENADQ